VRLHEKGDNEHEVPCHHNLERYPDEYIAGIADDPDGPLFRTAAPQQWAADRNGMWQQDAYRMNSATGKGSRHRDPDRQAHLPGDGYHCLHEEQGLLEHAQTLANHASSCTSKHYDLRANEILLDEVEKIWI
jgi:hypothetical protein